MKKSLAATWSLVFGILSITCLWFLGSIPAFILGAIGLKQTSGPEAEYAGRQSAIAGMVTGGIGLIFGVFSWGIIASIMIPAASVQERVDASRMGAEMAEISAAIRTYSITEGTYPKNLNDLSPLYFAGEASHLESNYRYRFAGFQSNAPSASPVVRSAFPSGGKYQVLYADGTTEWTGDESIILLFE